MKALVYVAPHSVEVRDVPSPMPASGKAKIAIHYCGICGSDISIFAGKHPRAKAPLILGHEFIGTVTETSGPESHFSPGDRVASYPLLSCGNCLPCRTGSEHVCEKLGLLGIDVDGGIAESAWVDERVLVKVPNPVSDKAAAVIEPLAVVVRSLHQASFSPLDSAVIMGAGPMGILTGMLLKHCGVSGDILISDIDAARLDICREFGLTPVNVKHDNLSQKVAEATEGNGADIVFECSGSGQAAMEMTQLARVGGTICLTGIHKEPYPVPLRDFVFKELKLVGTRVYTKREFELAAQYAANLGKELEKIVTHIVPLSTAENVFSLIADPQSHAMKVLVDCRQ